MRLLFSLVVLVVLVAGGAVYAFRSGLARPGAAERPVVEVTEEVERSAERKLEALANGGHEARLTDAEVTSLLRGYPEALGFDPTSSPVVTLRSDTVVVHGALATDRLPSDPAMDALRMLLPDTAQIGISGTIDTSPDGSSLFSIASLEVEGMPVPGRYLIAVLERLGVPGRDGGGDDIVIPLPPGIRSVAIVDGQLILTP